MEFVLCGFSRELLRGAPCDCSKSKNTNQPCKERVTEWDRQVLLHQAAETQELPGRFKTSSTNSCSSEKDCYLICKKSQGKRYHFSLNNVYPHLPGRNYQMPEGLSVWKSLKSLQSDAALEVLLQLRFFAF